MQRYRINYRLLFGVIAGALLLGSLLFFLVHPWQVNRKANLFLERAEQALSSNNLRVAFENQRKYVRLRPEEEEARVKLANLAVDITKLDDATREDHTMAYEVLDVAVRRTGDPGLRRKYADMLMGFGRPQDALVHIQLLQEQNPDDTELQALQVRALFFTKDFRRATDLALGLIGYDKKTKEFDPAKASAGDQPEIYALLGEVLYERSSTRELARQVMDRLVEANPESADAHLKRSIFYYKIRELEEASASLEKAYELAPTDAAVLQRKGLIAMADEDFDAAKEFYSKGLELHPDNLEFYQLLAQTEARRDEIDSALAVLNRGIERAGERNSIGLLMLKIKLLFVKNDLTAVSKEVDALSKIRGINLSTLQPLIDYQRARIKWQEKKWIEASKELNRVRPLLFGFPAEQADAGVLLASAYEQLGKLDLALQAYELVLQSQPQNAPALAGKSRIQARIHPESVADEDFGLNRLIQDMLARPEDQQDWDQVDAALVKNAEENGISEVRLSLHRAQVFLERQMFPEAEKLIQAAANLEPDNVNVRFAAVKLLLRNPGKGPEKGMSLLDRTEQQFGVSIQSRLLRIEALLMQGGDDAAEKIRALAEGVEQWDQNEQMQLYSSLGLAFQRLNQIPESLEYWKKAVELAPSSLPLRMHMFELALQQHDDEAIRDAQKKILDLVGDENDASYVLAEVKRRLVGFNFEKVSREEVLEARGMLEAALKRRPEWSELHVLYGQLLVLLNEDMDLALQHLDDALKYGPANSNAVGLQVQLLAKRGLNQEARKKMELLPADLRRKLLGSVEAEVLLATGDQEAAFKAAQEIAESQPEVAKTQLWFAKLAQQANQIEASAAAYYKAAELSPRDPDVWSQLLTLYALQNKPVELENAFREAELALDEEYLPLVTAKSFELQGRWKNAERVYLAVFEGRLDEIAVARRMADFYLIWAQADPANSKKAASFINRLLRASYEGKIPVDHPQASWARNQAARQLAVTGDYQNALRAQRLLTHGVGEDNLPVADQILLAEILATQSDPASQGKAIRLFTQLHENQRLQKNQILMFARLLRNANQWERCEDLMLDTLSKLGADTQVWSTYISMLIDRGEYSNAQSRINRLKQLDTQGNAYLPLMATLAHKQGDQATVTKTLKELLPENLGGALTPEQLQLVRKVASLAIDCGDLKLAEQLIQFYVQRTPEAAYELLRFHALHGDAAKAMAEMKSAFPNAMDQVLALATQMLRSRRPELGDQFDEDINQLVAAALRDDPDSAERLLFRAELLEIQQQYPQSAAAYDELLARKNVPERVRAAAMNNLAFLLALMGERLDDAEKLVNQAMEIIGPIDALLDTRALVRTAGKKYDLAIEDLLLAVVVNRDPLKYYHLARAQLLAGDAEAALKAWKEAQSLGIKKEKLPLIEQPGYEEFEAKIGNTDQT